MERRAPRTLTLEDIRRAMQRPRPGLAAQATMAPSSRPFHPPEGLPPPRQAGVLLLLYPFQDELHLVLTLRPSNLNHHPGQVSLPGGGREEGDRSLEETALREAEEELGISLRDAEVLGPLTPLYVPPSHNLVHPFVAYIPYRPLFQPDPVEVAEVVEVPLSTLLDPGIRRMERWERDGLEMVIPYYAVGPHKVWGATAIILAEFLAMLEG